MIDQFNQHERSNFKVQYSIPVPSLSCPVHMAFYVIGFLG